MQISNEQIQTLKQSIDDLTEVIGTLNMRLSAFAQKLGVVAKSIEVSSRQDKD